MAACTRAAQSTTDGDGENDVFNLSGSLCSVNDKHCLPLSLRCSGNAACLEQFIDVSRLLRVGTAKTVDGGLSRAAAGLC